MHSYYTNPYKMHIDIAQENHPKTKQLYTQERTAEGIGRSESTVKNWCSGVNVPGEEDVLSLAAYLKTPLLPALHLLYTSKIARRFLPTYEGKSLIESFVKLLKEFNDVKRIMDDITAKMSDENMSDGKISQDEALKLAPSLEQLRELKNAILCFEYAYLAESAEREE